MSRIFSLLLFSLLPFFSLAAEKNVIFFITDDQSPTLGCYGDPVAKTPAIDALAADGTRFTHAYATTASCSASRSVVMTGLHNHANGQYGHTHHFHKFSSYHDAIALSLPRTMANAGYRTGQIGKYHVAPEEVFHFESYMRGNSRNAVQMADQAKDFITADDERPFFLYFATSDPHRGGGNDKRYPGKHKPDLFGNKPNGGSHTGVDEVFYKPQEVPVPDFLPDTPECRSELAHYYQSVSRIDRGLARLVEILKEANLYDKTMIIFTADHGIAMPGGKTTVYEAGLNVPFVVRNPYEPTRGVVSNAMISHVDITPSIVDFGGHLDDDKNRPKSWKPARTYWQDKPYVAKENRNGGQKFDRYHGRSWIPLLGKKSAPDWDVIYGSHTFHEIQMYYPMRTIRDRKFKLIWNIAHGLPYPFASDLWAASTWQAQWEKGKNATYGKKTVDTYVNRPAFELYDVQKDPHEGNNLANEPEFAPVLKEYQDKLKAFQKASADPWIMKWRYE